MNINNNYKRINHLHFGMSFYPNILDSYTFKKTPEGEKLEVTPDEHVVIPDHRVAGKVRRYQNDFISPRQPVGLTDDSGPSPSRGNHKTQYLELLPEHDNNPTKTLRALFEQTAVNGKYPGNWRSY